VPDRAAPWPCLPSSFRAQASVRTRASTEKPVLSLSKRHPMVPLAHLGRGLRRDESGPSQEAQLLRYFSVFQTVLTVPHRPAPLLSTVLDAGCRPTTNHSRPTTLGWPFFLWYAAGFWGFMGVPADFGDRPTSPVRACFCSLLGVLTGAPGRSPQAAEIRSL
jgi:hypothetical protein